MTVCVDCGHLRRCHTLLDPDGATPLCWACVIALLADTETAGQTLTISITPAPAVTR